MAVAAIEPRSDRENILEQRDALHHFARKKRGRSGPDINSTRFNAP
jgi:hypothetical protein